jgi:transposase
MSEPTLCCRVPGRYCERCDLLVGLPGLHVVAVERDDGGALTVMVESAPGLMGCSGCGVVAHAHGRVDVRLVDAPAMGRPVRVVWRKRRWVCPEPACPVGSFVEQDERVAAPRALLTARACRWAIEQIRREHASINGVRRQLGTGWRTVWNSIRPLLEKADADPTRFGDVTVLGVDEHVWHHVSTKPIEDGGRGPKELTGMVDLTPDANGRTRARLLDLVPGRSGQAYKSWLTERGEQFRSSVRVATLDPFHGYKNAIDDQLDDARAVLDAFHVVKVRHEALCVRMEVRDLHRLVVAAAGLKLRAA